jgi:bacterioferritin-associated ferredoxin
LTWRNAPVNEDGIVDVRKTGLSMIVCSCNVLSDHQVRTAASTAARRSTSHIYGCLGCSAQCGRCARTIRRIIDEALDGAQFDEAKVDGAQFDEAQVGCPVGCGCAGAMHGAHADKL